MFLIISKFFGIVVLGYIWFVKFCMWFLFWIWWFNIVVKINIDWK